MENKKLNIITLILVVVMCAFSIGISTRNSSAKNGKDGQDGSDMSIVSVYKEYKTETGYEGSLSDFIAFYFDNIISENDESARATLAAQAALCSTVDICYSYFMPASQCFDHANGFVESGGQFFYKMQPATQPHMSVSAGSGVIYKMQTTGDVKTAYIITNFHVVYIEDYSNDPNYKLFTNVSTGETFTAKDKSFQENPLSYHYMAYSTVEEAPLETHFLETYSIYLNGYQSRDAALSASFVGGSEENDIAVLKVEYDPADASTSSNALIFDGNYAAAATKDSDSVSEYDHAIAVGNPLLPNTSNIDTTGISTYEEYLDLIEEAYINSLCLTTTGGRVSQITCEMPFSSIIDDTQVNTMRLIQVDAAVNPGNSGGGLYDGGGKLVGIVNGKIADASYDNVGFAIPINVASRIADQIIAQLDGNDGVSIKRLTVSGLGLEVAETTGANKPSFDGSWTYEYDVIVANQPNAFSKLNGKLMQGDVILSISFDGGQTEHKLTRSHQFDDLLIMAALPAGNEATTVRFKISRGGTTQTVDVSFTISDFVKII